MPIIARLARFPIKLSHYRTPARSFISVRTGEDEKEPGTTRVLSSPPLQKTKAQRWATTADQRPTKRVMIFTCSRNTKGGLEAALELSLSRAPRFAPYKQSLSLHAINVKWYKIPAGDFREDPGEIRTHDL